jgi:hypothetical protein
MLDELLLMCGCGADFRHAYAILAAVIRILGLLVFYNLHKLTLRCQAIDPQRFVNSGIGTILTLRRQTYYEIKLT